MQYAPTRLELSLAVSFSIIILATSPLSAAICNSQLEKSMLIRSLY